MPGLDDRLDDPEIAGRLLHHLARTFGCPAAVYLAGPARIQGGFDTTIFGFTLDAVPPPLQGPLILRLSRPGADPQRVKLETVVQNTLAGMGYPAPEVMASELDPDILGGPFMVMRRVPGQTLAHEAEGLGAGRSLTERVRLLFSLPSILGGIIEQWVDMQIRLHQLSAGTLLQAVTAAGIDIQAVTFEGQLARLGTAAERYALSGLEPALAWLRDHRPPPAQAAICHGDFHPLNVMMDGEHLSGVIDWSQAVLAEPAFDIAATRVILRFPNLGEPPWARWPLHWARRLVVHRYTCAYRAARPFATRNLAFFEAMRVLHALAVAGTTPPSPRDPWNRPHTLAALYRHFERVSGVRVRI